MTDQDSLLDVDVDEPRTVAVIEADARGVPDALNRWRRDLDTARHKVLTSLSGVADDTDLSALRTQFVDEGLQRTEEQIVSAADVTIKRLQNDLDALESVAWKHDLTVHEAARLPVVLATVTEVAQQAAALEILAEIDSALIRADREQMVAWATVGARLRNRTDIPAMDRYALANKIAECRSRVSDRSLNSLTSTIRKRIQELREHRNSIVDLVSETDEVPSGPLHVYRFGRRNLNAAGGSNPPRRPQPTAKWFRQRIGRGDAA